MNLVVNPVRADAARRATRRPVIGLRRLHSWAGALFAPTILFFAATGVLQVFNLHKPQAGGYQPPAVLREIAGLHKNQLLPKLAPPSPPVVVRSGGTAPRPMPLGQSLLKAYAAAAGTILALTTCVGVYLGLRSPRDRRWTVGLCALGVVLPIALLALG